MKKTFLIVVLAMTALVTSAFCGPFSPSPLVLSAASDVFYAFDGKTLSMQVTATGAPSDVIFFIYTKNKGETISKIRNGYLGWHYMNKIDTCIYFSRPYNFEKGVNTVAWDGNDQSGAPVAPGAYTYYLWGYDARNAKTVMTSVVTMDHRQHSTIVTHGADGSPLTQPIFYKANGSQKWVIGSDPADATQIETTALPTNRQFILQPDDHSSFFIQVLRPEKGEVAKYKWVPNGASTLVTEWGTDSGMSFFHSGDDLTGGGIGDSTGGMTIVGGQIICGIYDRDSADANTVLCYLDMVDGSLVKTVNLSSRWANVEDNKKGGQMVGGPGELCSRNGMVFLSTYNACYREMIDPTIQELDEYVLWGNGNGDGTGDHNFEPNSPRPWLCFDYNVSPYAYVTDADANLFSTFGAYDMGAVSFGLIGPDGTGLGYYAYAGETANFKQGNIYCDYGSPYDGIYTDLASQTTSVTGQGIGYLAHDSIKGTISNQVGVADASPSAFTVAQNSPNPFNPTTTITFTLAKAGKTTVEVYNVAGQKISTLVDGSMSAGSHSVVWNASNVSAGVYFYTVRSGSFSKTMKMTLLK